VADRWHPSEKRSHLLGDLISAVSNGVAPAAGRVIAGKDEALGSRQASRRGCRRRGRRPALSGNHQNAIGDVGKWRRVESTGHAQYDAGQAFWMPSSET